MRKLANIEAVGVVCFSRISNEILLVNQYRESVDTETYEIPGGGVKEGESTSYAAARELGEETGVWLTDIDMQSLGRIYLQPAHQDKVFQLFYTEVEDFVFNEPDPDYDEDIEVVRIDIDEAMKWVLESDCIVDGRSAYAIMKYYLTRYNELKI